MKAIRTKYMSPTAKHGARVMAKEPDGKYVMTAWDHELDTEQNHVAAARKLCEKLKWPTDLVSGWDRDYYVHIPQRRA